MHYGIQDWKNAIPNTPNSNIKLVWHPYSFVFTKIMVNGKVTIPALLAGLDFGNCINPNMPKLSSPWILSEVHDKYIAHPYRNIPLQITRGNLAP